VARPEVIDGGRAFDQPGHAATLLDRLDFLLGQDRMAVVHCVIVESQTFKMCLVGPCNEMAVAVDSEPAESHDLLVSVRSSTSTSLCAPDALSIATLRAVEIISAMSPVAAIGHWPSPR
jgi:hypothetical protein